MLGEVRKQKGLSQLDLAKATGISQRMIQSYEQGQRDINGAKLKTILILAKALECNIGDIVTDEKTIKLLEEL